MARPSKPIFILALVHILAPAAEVFCHSILHGVSPVSVILSDWQRHSVWQVFDLYLTLPFAGLSILWMRSWSYLIFVTVMGWEVFSNFQTWKDYPQFISLANLTTLYVFDLGLVAYWLAPAVRSVRAEVGPRPLLATVRVVDALLTLPLLPEPRSMTSGKDSQPSDKPAAA